jgi:hypothetical protein
LKPTIQIQATMVGVASVLVLLAPGCSRARHDQRPDAFVEAMVGDVVCRPDGNAWAGRGSTAFVIVMSPKCGACQATRDFSEEIDSYGKDHKLPIIYILPSRPDLDAGAAELSASGKTVLRANLHDFGVIHMPTYLRVDSSGVIQSRWTGSVATALRGEVFASLVVGSSLDAYQVIPATEMDAYASRPRAQILALSELNKRPGSRVIPFSELDIRAKYELERDATTLIDCGTTLHPWQCQEAAMDLAKARFAEVVVVGLPARSNTCSAGSRR